MILRPLTRSLVRPIVGSVTGPRYGRPRLGPELVVNGAFDSDSTWIKSAGWTISGGVLAADAAAFSVTTQPLSPTVGSSYEVTFDVVTRTSGGIRASFLGGTAVVGASWTTTGTYSVVLVAATGNTSLAVGANGTGFVGSIDNVSVREILS